MFQAIAIYFLLGAILSVILGITSRHPLPLWREVIAHTTIAILWPIVLIHIALLLRRISDSSAKSKSDNDFE